MIYKVKISGKVQEVISRIYGSLYMKLKYFYVRLSVSILMLSYLLKFPIDLELKICFVGLFLVVCHSI